MDAAPVPPREERSTRSPASVAADFAMGGAAAVVAKTGAAPVECVKLLLQNQGEMLRRGTLTRPYKGIADAFARVLRRPQGLFPSLQRHLEGVLNSSQPVQHHPPHSPTTGSVRNTGALAFWSLPWSDTIGWARGHGIVVAWCGGDLLVPSSNSFPLDLYGILN